MNKSKLIIGRQPLIEAIRAQRAVDKILMQRNVAGESIGEIRQLAREHAIPVQVVPVEKLDSLTRANHQGVVAFAGLVQYMDLQQVVDHVVGGGGTPLFVMLDGVTDVRNIGAIARSAFSGEVTYPELADLVSEEVEVKGHDGTPIPLSIIHRKDLRLDGSTPCILEGYGVTECASRTFPGRSGASIP